MSWLETKIPPPIVALICAALAWLVQPYWLLGMDQQFAHIIAALGLAKGVGLDLLAIGHMYRVKTTINPLAPHRASQLVTTGIYRFTRNPMYLSLAIYLACLGIWLDSGTSLMMVAVFVLYINRMQIRPEERSLLKIFGQPYVDYCKTVGRWF